jgi:hypothetical protein
VKPPISGDLAQMPKEIPHEWVPRVADTLIDNPDFIKAGFHIGRFITPGVDTEKEPTITDVVKMNMEFASKQIDVSISFPFHILLFLPIPTLLLSQQLIKHSQSKDRYIKVTLKRLTEMHFVDDELTEEKALNQTLLARNEELETQLAAEIQEKIGKSTFNINLIRPQRYLD